MTTTTICPPSDTFDISHAANLYANLAGVLAGFAFFALIYILQALQVSLRKHSLVDEENRSEQNHIVVTLSCALLSLIVATFLYAILASEQNESLTQGRASTEELTSGVALAFSVMALLYGLTITIAGAGLVGTGHEVRLLIALLGPPLASMFLGFAGQDSAYVEYLSTGRPSASGQNLCEQTAFFREITLWGTGVMPVTVFVIVVLMTVLSRTCLHVDRFSLPRGRGFFTRNALPKLTLVFSVGAAIRSATLSERDPTVHLNHASIWFLLIVASIGLCVQAAVILWGQAGESLLEADASEGGRHSSLPFIVAGKR